MLVYFAIKSLRDRGTKRVEVKYKWTVKEEGRDLDRSLTAKEK